MLLTDKVQIKVISKSLHFYKNKGYNVNCNEEIIVKIEDLSTHCLCKVKVKCDYCDKEKEISFSRYNLNTNNGQRKYACNHKCSREKSKETNMLLYNIDNPSKSETIKAKKKNTTLKHYNVEYPAQSEEIINKMKETFIKIYGTEWISQCDEIKEKVANTNIERYGNKCSLCNEEINEKRKQTWLKNYGFEHPFKSDKVKSKIYHTMIKNGYRSFDKGYKLYLKVVNSLTNFNKKELFENWNGIDFYDNEDIKENLGLNSNSSEYPTVDHKTSVLYGFLNNIQPEEIAKIENLCITKRSINSKKGSKTAEKYQDFVSILKSIIPLS
jgi:hypothetical protein